MYGCNTIVKSSYITVTGNNGPIAASCSPASLAPCCNLGIYNVTLNTINNNTTTTGYQDYSCSIQTTLLPGTAYPITVRNGTRTPENVRVYIDYNNDGTFNPTTELVFSSNNKLIHTGAITSPVTAVQNTPLRMRIFSDQAQNMNITPCTQPQYSQIEDYAVTISLANGYIENNAASLLNIYPNPNHGTFSLQLSTVSGNSGLVEIQNLLGQTVAKMALKPGLLTHEIKADQLPKGIYLVKIINAGFSAMKKIVVE
jgi:hypothetical protein